MTNELILVDDDPIFLIILQKMIRIVNPDCRMIPFHDGNDALAYLCENPDQQKSRHVLLDINLKDMSAWDLMDRLIPAAVLCPEIILMTSSVSSQNSERAATYAPVIGFFEKPITLEIIRQIFELTTKD